MPLLQSRQIFEPSCPSGGTWYSCGGGSNFVGCCTRDPCNSVGCADGNLRAASFNTDYYGNFSDAVCQTGQFYTCTATDPPFLGCCKSNACQADGNAGCPQADLSAATLPSNSAQASAYSPTGGPSSTASPTSTASSSSSSTSTAGIVGAVVGAVVVLLFVVGALLWRRRQQRKKKAAAGAGNNTINEADGRPISEMGGGGGSGAIGGSGKPPRYSSLTNPGSPNPFAMELDGFPRKSPHEQQTPSELGSGDAHQLHAELPAGDAIVMHELEGSSPGTTFTGTPATGSMDSPSSSSKKAATHSRGSSWSSFVERRAARRASAGGGGNNGPTGLAIQGLHPYSQVGGRGNNNNGSPRSSPRSPSFPREGGGDEYAGSESGVSSLPSTPRSAYGGYGPGAGTMGGYSDVSRLSPTYPPPIREEERYRDHDHDDDDDDDDENRNERR